MNEELVEVVNAEDEMGLEPAEESESSGVSPLLVGAVAGLLIGGAVGGYKWLKKRKSKKDSDEESNAIDADYFDDESRVESCDEED